MNKEENQKNNNENIDETNNGDLELDDITFEEDSDSRENIGGDMKLKFSKLKEKLKEALADKQKYLDNWQRDKAEFLNARKRDKEAQEQFIKFANESLIEDLISVLLSFEMAFSHKESWEKADKNWRAGITSIYNQLKQILEARGVKEINPINQNFDALYSESIEMLKTNKKEEDHIVLEVLEKGYTLNGKVVKPAKVKIGEYVD